MGLDQRHHQTFDTVFFRKVFSQRVSIDIKTLLELFGRKSPNKGSKCHYISVLHPLTSFPQLRWYSLIHAKTFPNELGTFHVCLDDQRSARPSQE
jgi:hypothetical protein